MDKNDLRWPRVKYMIYYISLWKIDRDCFQQKKIWFLFGFEPNPVQKHPNYYVYGSQGESKPTNAVHQFWYGYKSVIKITFI